jgi:uncharacterized protein YqeY
MKTYTIHITHQEAIRSIIRLCEYDDEIRNYEKAMSKNTLIHIIDKEIQKIKDSYSVYTRYMWESYTSKTIFERVKQEVLFLQMMK